MLKMRYSQSCRVFASLAVAALIFVPFATAQEPKTLNAAYTPEPASPEPMETTESYATEATEGAAGESVATPDPVAHVPGGSWDPYGPYDWCNEKCYCPKCWGAYPFMGPVCRWNTVTKPRLTDYYWGYAEEFCERPFGSYTRAALNKQVYNGLVAQVVLYNFDFRDPATNDTEKAAKLTRRGILQLIKAVDKLKYVVAPLVIEPTGNDELDEARRQHVIAYIHDDLEYPIPDESVIVSKPCARGLSGDQAVIVRGNMLFQSERGGAFIPELNERQTIFNGAGSDNNLIINNPLINSSP